MDKAKNLLNGDRILNVDAISTAKEIDYTSELIEVNTARLLKTFEHGSKIAEASSIKLEAIDTRETTFSWMRGFIICITGFPNHGKSDIMLFLRLAEAVLKGRKTMIWSPEMYGAEKIDGKIFKNADDVVNLLVWMYSGQTPYKHIADKYRTRLISKEDYKKAIEFVREHFLFVSPKDRGVSHICDLAKTIYDKEFAYDCLITDPFKNIKKDTFAFLSDWMEECFAQFKELSLNTDSVTAIVAHPKAGVISKRNDGGTNMPTQHNLSGGAAWDNSMDGIYTHHRPFHGVDNSRAGEIEFATLKQRKQELTNSIGICHDLTKDLKTGRYLIKGVDVLSKGNGVKIQFEEKPYQLPIVPNNFDKPLNPPKSMEEILKEDKIAPW